MRRDDRRDARLGVVFLGVHRVAAGRDDAQRLKRLAFHDHVLRRPIGPGDRVAVLPALHLRRLHRARLDADLDLGDHVRQLHPQIDQADLGVAPDDVDIAARCRDARDMHRIAGLDDLVDLIVAAIDQRHLAGVAQGDREQVLDVDVVLLAGRTFVDRHQDLPARLHFRHAPFRRLGRLMEQVTRHEVDLVLGHVAGGAPVRHAGRRTVGDERLQIVHAQVAGDVGGQRLAGGAAAQHAVTAGASLEIDARGLAVLGLGHFRDAGHGAGVDRLHLRERFKLRHILGFVGVFIRRLLRPGASLDAHKQDAGRQNHNAPPPSDPQSQHGSRPP